MSEYIGQSTSGAVFSKCLRYRYSLWRRWEDCEPSQMVAFIGLNPSTADEFKNDPTIRRCIRFSKDWGYSGMIMLNLFAYRATDPKEMKAQVEPFGDENAVAIMEVCRSVDAVICAWGVHGAYRNRGEHVRSVLAHFMPEKLFHLGLTQNGYPKHPLFLKNDLTPQPWKFDHGK